MHAFDQMTEPELKTLFRNVCEVIKGALPDQTGFILLAAPLGGPGVAQYAGNVQREDATRWMEETALRLRTGDVVPREEWATAVDVGRMKRRIAAASALIEMADSGFVSAEDLQRALAVV